MLLGISSLTASQESVAWSKPDNGLRGRLLVLSSEKTDSPFCRIFIELQNVADVMGQRRIRFNPEKLELEVTDKKGKLPLTLPGAYSAMTPLWETTLLPYASTMRFQVSFPGMGYQPATDKVIVDIGPSKTWVIPQDGSVYYLSGTFSVSREKSDHPHMDWSGTLNLPKVEIPKAK